MHSQSLLDLPDRRTGDDGDRDFYIVWSPGGPTPPKVRHFALHEAQREAERLARAHPGQRFFVMAAASVSVLPTATTKAFPNFTASLPF